MVGGTFGTDTPATGWLEPFAVCPWKSATAVVPDKPILLTKVADPLGASGSRSDVRTEVSNGPGTRRAEARPQTGGAPKQTVPHWQVRDPITSWALLSSPATEGLLATGLSVRAVASVLLCGLLATAVWAFFGAAICRIAAVQLAADEQVGLGSALRYACRKWPSYFAAPLLPVGGVLLAAIPGDRAGFHHAAGSGCCWSACSSGRWRLWPAC